jgi:hypothetical protein
MAEPAESSLARELWSFFNAHGWKLGVAAVALLGLWLKRGPRKITEDRVSEAWLTHYALESGEDPEPL